MFVTPMGIESGCKKLLSQLQDFKTSQRIAFLQIRRKHNHLFVVTHLSLH